MPSMLARMGQLLGFGGRQESPARVPTDQVLPMRWYDDSSTTRKLICTWTMVFDDVLDADKLAAALSRLAEIDDWKKIGGRIRLNAQGKLELHVPERFTAERPAIEYTHETLDVAIGEHPLASRLPKPTPGPSLQEGAPAFEALARPAGAPRGLDDYLRADRPQLGLHVVSFADATTVTVAWPHTLSDAMGISALVANWARVLGGREAEVAPLRAVHEDPYARLGDGAGDEPYALADKLLGGWRMLCFAARFVYAQLLGPKQSARCIFLPAAALARLRARALQDLAGDAPGGAAPPPFLSDGDVLLAWVLRMVCRAEPPGRPVGVFNAAEVRGRLPEIFDPAAAYVGNFAVAVWTHLAAGEAAAGPLGRTAAALRASVAAQGTAAQTRALLRLVRGPGGSGAATPPLALGRPDALFVICSSWAKARVLEVADFRAAVVGAGAGDAAGRRFGPGRPVHFFGSSPTGARTTRDCISVLGKDARGDYYISATLDTAAWSAFEEDMRAMPGAQLA